MVCSVSNVVGLDSPCNFGITEASDGESAQIRPLEQRFAPFWQLKFLVILFEDFGGRHWECASNPCASVQT
jgi:hypothetical protein